MHSRTEQLEKMLKSTPRMKSFDPNTVTGRIGASQIEPVPFTTMPPIAFEAGDEITAYHVNGVMGYKVQRLCKPSQKLDLGIQPGELMIIIYPPGGYDKPIVFLHNRTIETWDNTLGLRQAPNCYVMYPGYTEVHRKNEQRHNVNFDSEAVHWADGDYFNRQGYSVKSNAFGYSFVGPKGSSYRLNGKDLSRKEYVLRGGKLDPYDHSVVDLRTELNRDSFREWANQAFRGLTVVYTFSDYHMVAKCHGITFEWKSADNGEVIVQFEQYSYRDKNPELASSFALDHGMPVLDKARALLAKKMEADRLRKYLQRLDKELEESKETE